MASFLNDVKFTSSTSGTADFGIGAAASGFQTPAEAGAVDETNYSYTARKNAQFESGVGSYEATGPVLERTTVLDSSAGFGVKVDFTSAPTVILSPLKEDLREKLTADRTYYVRTDGSDSNTGLANTAGGAWLTLQYASDMISRALDFNGFNVIVQIGDGDYVGFAINSPIAPLSYAANWNTVPPATVISAWYWRGNPTDHTAVTIQTEPVVQACCLMIGAMNVGLFFSNVTFDASNLTYGAGAIFVAFANAQLSLGEGDGGTIKFIGGTNGVGIGTGGEAMAAQFPGVVIAVSDNIEYSGIWDYFFQAQLGGSIVVGWNGACTITAIGTPHFGGAFAAVGSAASTFVDTASITFGGYAPCTFVGSATGIKFKVGGPNCVIGVLNGDLNTLHGDLPGIITFGGSYCYTNLNGRDVIFTSDRQTSIVTLTSAPTTSDLTEGACGIFKETGGGTIKMYVNDGGVIKASAALT